MSKILVFAGPKQSGKTSAARFVAGYTLMNLGKIPSFNMDHDGKLWVPVEVDGETLDGELDIGRTDFEFAEYASYHIWPYVKIYSFAESLKEAVNTIFGIDLALMRGTDEDKSTKTDIRWSDMAKLLPPRSTKTLRDEGKIADFMTIREVLQYFGTNVCRTMKDSCWVDACYRKIKAEQPALAIIDDCRFPNEVDISVKNDAKVCRLQRTIGNDDHASEQALKKVPDKKFHKIIANQDLTLAEKNVIIQNTLAEWGWLKGQI